MKYIHLITKDQTDLWAHKGRRLRYQEANFNDPDDAVYYHLYEVKKEKLEIGDWYLFPDTTTDEFGVHQITTERLKEIANERNVLKIIASTNPILEIDGIETEEIEMYIYSQE